MYWSAVADPSCKGQLNTCMYIVYSTLYSEGCPMTNILCPPPISTSQSSMLICTNLNMHDLAIIELHIHVDPHPTPPFKITYKSKQRSICYPKFPHVYTALPHCLLPSTCAHNPCNDPCRTSYPQTNIPELYPH